MISPRSTFPRLVGLIAVSLCFLGLAGSDAPPAITVVRQSDLDFGDIAAGSAQKVDYDSGQAAIFELSASGVSGLQEIHISFALPTHIVNGGRSIPVTFGSQDAAWSYVDIPATATPFDPSAGVVVPNIGSVFKVFVWIGASVNVSPIVPANQYANDLFLSAEIK